MNTAIIFGLLALCTLAAPNLAGGWNIGGSRIGYIYGPNQSIIQQDFEDATFTAVNTTIRQHNDQFWWDLSAVFPGSLEFPCTAFDLDKGAFSFVCISTINGGHAFGSGDDNRPSTIKINFANAGFGPGFLDTPFITRGSAYRL